MFKLIALSPCVGFSTFKQFNKLQVQTCPIVDSWYWFNYFGKTKFRFKQNHKRGIMFGAGNGFCF